MFTSRERFLVAVQGVDPVKWATLYDIEKFSAPCRCGSIREATLPFAVGGLRGLIAPKCPCGEPNPPYCVVAAQGDLIDQL